VQSSVNDARNRFLQAQSLSLSIVATAPLQDGIVAQNACNTIGEKNKGLVPVEVSHQAQIVVCCHRFLKVSTSTTQQDKIRKLTATVATSGDITQLDVAHAARVHDYNNAAQRGEGELEHFLYYKHHISSLDFKNIKKKQYQQSFLLETYMDLVRKEPAGMQG
jgi:hypothetical protein